MEGAVVVFDQDWLDAGHGTIVQAWPSPHP
jgi:hypothetical protein